MTQAIMLHAPTFCRVGSLTHPDLSLFLLPGPCICGAPGRGPERRKGAARWGGTCPVSMLRVRVIDLHVRTGSSSDNGVCLFLPVLGLALDLGNGGLFIARLGVSPLGAGHALFGHSITSMFVMIKTAALPLIACPLGAVMKRERVLMMNLEMDEIAMTPVMVVRVPVMPAADKIRLREEIMSSIFDGLLLLEDGLSYEIVDLPVPRAWTPELRELEPPPGPHPEATEKREILARLQVYRMTNGLGCFSPLAKNCGKGVTATTLRNILNGDEVYPIEVWRQVGKGLDKLGASVQSKK